MREFFRQITASAIDTYYPSRELLATFNVRQLQQLSPSFVTTLGLAGVRIEGEANYIVITRPIDSVSRYTDFLKTVGEDINYVVFYCDCVLLPKEVWQSITDQAIVRKYKPPFAKGILPEEWNTDNIIRVIGTHLGAIVETPELYKIDFECQVKLGLVTVFWRKGLWDLTQGELY